MNIRKTSLLFTLALALFVGGLSFANSNHASADYNGARIIDNGVFLNANSMNVSQIQSFLASQGSGLASRSFVLQCYGAGSQERQLYTSVGAACDQNMSASHIIYYASRIYGINPQVILATLQKEQSLITTGNPTSWQLNQAMGYGCPTTGNCSGNSTFSYQIDSGAWVLRYHYERANGNNNWWSPSTSWVCGTEKNFYKPNLYPRQNVRFYDGNNVLYRTYFIENAATSSFYCYTPHAYNNPRAEFGRPAFGTTGQYYSGSYNFVYWFERWFDVNSIPPNNSDLAWNFESLRGKNQGVLPSNNQTGYTPKTISYQNNLYVFHYDATSKSLRAEIATNLGWNEVVIDGQGSIVTGSSTNDVGLHPKSVVYQNELYVFYYDQTNQNLKQAKFDGTTWAVSTLDGDSNNPSSGKKEGDIGLKASATVYGDSLQLFYYDASGGNLRHAWTTPTQGWKFEDLDGTRAAPSGYNANVGNHSSATKYGDSLQLFYYDASGGNLRHAWTTPTQGWKFEDLDGTNGSIGQYNSDSGVDTTSLSIDSQGKLVVLYKANDSVRYAWAGPQGWRFALLDGNASSLNSLGGNRTTGTNPTAVLSGTSLQLFYSENGVLRHAWSNY